MTVAWQTIPGQGLYTSEKLTQKRRETALKRITQALGDGLTQTLLDKELLILLPTFDGCALLDIYCGKAMIPMQRSCIYMPAHNAIYINLEHCNEPAFMAHIVSTLACDTALESGPDLVLCSQACSQLLDRFSDDPLETFVLRKNYHQKVRIAIRAHVDQLPILNAFLEDYWLIHHEGQKPLPAVDDCLAPELGKNCALDPSAISEADIVTYLFGNIYHFAQTDSKTESSGVDIPQAPAWPIRLAALAQKTTAQLPSIEKLFGKRLNKNGLRVSSRFPYPADMGKVGTNSNPRNTWNLDAELRDVNWKNFFSFHAAKNKKRSTEPSVFSTGIVMALAPKTDASINIAVTHEIDMAHSQSRFINVLPWVSQQAKPIVAQIQSCSVPPSLDWAVLSLTSPDYDFHFSVLNTSWLAQANKLSTHTDYSLNLSFWAMSASPAQKENNQDVCLETDSTNQGLIPHYQLTAKITQVIGPSQLESLEYTIFNVKPCFNKASYPEMTVALPTRIFKAQKLGTRKTVLLHGIFLAASFNELSVHDVDIAQALFDEPGVTFMQKSRYFKRAFINNDITPEAASIYLGRLVDDITKRHRFSQGYYQALKAASAYGNFESLLSLVDLYEKQISRREQHKAYNSDFILDCENKVLNRFLELCQMGKAANLEFLAIHQNEWLPTPPDIRERVTKHLALEHNSGMAWEELARIFRNGRALVQLSQNELITYRGYLEHAIFERSRWIAAKPLIELYMSELLPNHTIEEMTDVVLLSEKTLDEAQSWFIGLVLMQQKFFTATQEEIFDVFKAEVQSGSPSVVQAFAWFLLSSAFHNRHTPKDWALTGVALLYWLAARFECPAYYQGGANTLFILRQLGIAHRLRGFNPWKYLDLKEPDTPIALVKTARPLGFPGYMHVPFLESLVGINGDESMDQVKKRFSSIFEFMISNATEIGNLPQRPIADMKVSPGGTKLLSFGQKDQNECVLAHFPNAKGFWGYEAICPVFNEGLMLDMKLIGGVTDLGLCNGVVTATSNGSDTLHCFDPYWLLHAQELCVGDVCHITYYGLGTVEPAWALLHLSGQIDARDKHVECFNERTAQYGSCTIVKSVKRNAIEIAGVSFAKVVILLNDFVPHLANVELPIYVPMDRFNPATIKPRTEVFATFELHGKINKQSEVPEIDFGKFAIN